MSVIPEQRKAIVSYPTNFRMSPKEIQVRSKSEVKSKYEVEAREFIFDTLRRWTIDRNRSYSATNTLTPKRSIAVDKILLMLSHHKGSRLHVLCSRIVQDGEYFIQLIPGKQSRYFLYFKEVIAQILIWCEWYSINHEQFNKNLIREVN